MFDKYKYSLDKIKEVKLWWDFEYVIFPKEVIKRLEYEINEENSMSYRCLVSSFRIEVDLDYVNSGYESCTKIEILQSNLAIIFGILV